LKERREAKFEPLDVGRFYHCILDILLKQVGAEGKDFATMEDEELLGLLRKQISGFVLTDGFISNFCRHRAHNAYIIQSAGEALEDCVLAIAEMVRAGDFRPRVSEIWFGEARDGSATMGDYEISLSDGRKLFMVGKIDRIDVAGTGGQKTAIIFDYKRKGKSLGWSELYYGLDMQLAIYMLAVRKAGESPCKNIVGAFYMPVEAGAGKTYKANGIFNGEFFRQLDGKVESCYSQFYNFRVSRENGQYGDYGRSGALKPEDFEKVLKFAEEKVIQLTEGILSGEIKVKPYRLGTDSPCGYCEYKAVCRFDWLVNDYNFLKSVSKADVLKETGEGND
jgi:ATP-dependent helicase/nuclease subunit B